MPRKRAEVMVADFDTELVVLVPEERRTHHLDEGLSLVLDSCDGVTPTADVVDEIAAGTGATTEAVQSWLKQSLETLDELSMLEDPRLESELVPTDAQGVGSDTLSENFRRRRDGSS
jgi:hypothetical protein